MSPTSYQAAPPRAEIIAQTPRVRILRHPSAWCGNFPNVSANGLLKLIFAKADRRLLGVQIIGESPTESIHLGTMALESGMKIDVFIEFVFNYPTLSEMYKYAAYDGLGNLAGYKLREG